MEKSWMLFGISIRMGFAFGVPIQLALGEIYGELS